MNFKSGIQTNRNRLYRIWVNMKTRCYNPNGSRFNRYGGKGITICREWLDDYMNFHRWAMANGYSDDLSIDRIDGNGNYEPSNCRWVDWRAQNRNKENIHVYEYNGIRFISAGTYKLFGVKRTTFQARLKRGLSVEDALKGSATVGK